MTSVVASAVELSLSNLPDDVLLGVFACMDFSSIIALRQTCRTCYHLSKTTGLWLDVHRWITEGAEDWRAPLAECRSLLSADELERAVTRLVRFERNWNRGSLGARGSASFCLPGGFVSAFIPGGRWFLASVRAGTRGIMSYDFNALTIQGAMLIRQEDQDQEIWAMDFSSDSHFMGPSFDLAVEVSTSEYLPPGDYKDPRKITIWRIVLDASDLLVAKFGRTFPVFQPAPFPAMISLTGNSLLRVSRASFGHPVFTVHNWRGLGGDNVTHSILVPRRKDTPSGGVRLLSDGRIVSISDAWVEIYAPPDLQWEESSIVREDVPQSSPLWVFEHDPPVYHYHHAVSRTLLTSAGDWASFWTHNGDNLFSFRIPLRSDLEPEVTSKSFGQIEGSSRIGLGTSHSIVSTLRQTDAILNTLDYRPGMRRLFAFAGVEFGNRGLENRIQVAGTRFISPYPATAHPWLIDERSGRVLCVLSKELKYVVLYFVD